MRHFLHLKCPKVLHLFCLWQQMQWLKVILCWQLKTTTTQQVHGKEQSLNLTQLQNCTLSTWRVQYTWEQGNMSMHFISFTNAGSLLIKARYHSATLIDLYLILDWGKFFTKCRNMKSQQELFWKLDKYVSLSLVCSMYKQQQFLTI